MFRLTVKNLLANKIRLALTTFGAVLAVSLVVAAFVLGDGLNRSFVGVSEEVTAGVDLEVRTVADFGDPPPLPPDAVTRVAAIDGVADAAASTEAAHYAFRPIRSDGTPIPTSGPPQLAFAWIDNPSLSAFRLVAGAAPEPGEFTMDVDSAAEHGFVIGETYDVFVPDGRVPLRLSGMTSFGAENHTLGAVLMQVHPSQTPELFGVDGIGSVAVQLADDADVDAVRAAITTAVPGTEVMDHAALVEESAEQFTVVIDIVRNVLLGFGGVALFVSIFIIYNTFGIVLAQRTRELALLRSVGADPTQIRRSVLGEALVVGVIAAIGGVAGGIGLAKGIEALFGVIGADLPDYPLVLATRTLVAAAVIGIGVTVLSALGPARRAASVPPIAALRSGGEAGGPASRTRMVTGTALFAGGLLAGSIGLAGVGPNVLTTVALAAGAIAMVLGVTVLSPLAVGAVTAVFGWPLRRVAGTAGALAQRNAARNPRRTATTAAALMIGLALVSTALVVGQSVKSTVAATFERSGLAEYYVTDDLDDVDFPATLAAEIRRFPAVDAASSFATVPAKVDGEVTEVTGADFTQLAAVLDLGVQAGSVNPSATNPVLVSVEQAATMGVTVGDTIPIAFANGTSTTTTVVGLFEDQAVVPEDFVVDTTVLADAGVPHPAAWIAISTAAGAPASEVEALVAEVSQRFPHASVETAAQFRDRVVGMIDKVLTMVNVMVALAVIIALIGIANTLALSVFERTRELGLVRAVGMTRRQLRRMVRFEAALVAVFGATLGVGLGLLFGAGVVAVLPPMFADGLAVPAVPIAMVVAVAGAAGTVAAWLPARRAGRLDVLDAITR